MRPVRRSDADALEAFHSGLSELTVYLRFFAPHPELTKRDLLRFTNVDFRDHIVLVAVLERSGSEHVIGMATADRIDAATAEVSFTVADEHQGRGLGSVFLEHLAAACRQLGFRRFVAEVLPSNERMIETFERAGYRPFKTVESGVIKIEFEIDNTSATRAVMQAREHRAEAASMTAFMNASSVAVVGDFARGDRESEIANSVLSTVIAGGFQGRLYAVGEGSQEAVGNSRSLARTTVRECESVELVIVSLPPDRVLGMLDECAEVGARAMVVASGGFADIGVDGRTKQRTLVQSARARGMRIVGPNALGLVNTSPGALLNASAHARMPARGPLGIFCQSASLGSAILREAERRSLGLTTFLSAGNRADVSANDALQYWEDDPATQIALLYLESIGNPRKFARIARRFARKKPIVTLRSTRSTQSLPIGHTTRRTSLPAQALEESFASAGVIQVNSLREMYDVAALLAFQPLPTGRRLAVVANGGTLGVMAADAAEAHGLDVVGEPASLRAAAAPDEIREALADAINDDESHSVLMLYAPPVGIDDAAIRRVLVECAASSPKPVAAVFIAEHESMQLDGPLGPHGLPGRGTVPVYGDVASGVRAIARVVEYVAWRGQPEGQAREFRDVERVRARHLVEEALEEASERGELGLLAMGRTRLEQLLDCYGIAFAPSRPVRREQDAVDGAEEVGYPVVLKATLPSQAHLAHPGALRTHIENETALRTAYLSLVATLSAEAQSSLVVQHMSTNGVPCVLGTVEDPLFGPVVSFGLAGPAVELLADRSYRLPPLDENDARGLISSPISARLLEGWQPDPLNLESLSDLVQRVGQLADDLPELALLELNPVYVSPREAIVLGARGWLAPGQQRADLEARRLNDVR